MFMQLAIFRKIGFFDEDFFMFAEDNELCDRVAENGYKNVIIHNAIAFHLGGGSSKKSLRITYRRFWHLGWSKSKYKQKRKGKIQNFRATSRLVIIYFIESLFYLLTYNFDKSVSKFAFCSGCFSYLIGLKAFRKDGAARG
jgi:GT2 family glycosyltransferase